MGVSGQGGAGASAQGGSGQGGQPLFSPCGAAGQCDWVLQGVTQALEPLVVYVRFEGGKALVAPAFDLPAPFTIELTEYPQVTATPKPGGNPGDSVVHGPVELRPEPGSSSPLDLLALTLTPAGTLEGPSQVVRQGDAACLGFSSPQAHATTTSLDTTGASLVLLDRERPLLSLETHRIAPWSPVTVKASKSVTTSLTSLSEATTGAGQSVSLDWKVTPQGGLTREARATFTSWAGLLGQTVSLKVKAETPQGVASMSETSLPMFSFGPARAGLSFIAGLPSDLEVWGTPPPLSELCNTGQGCLKLDSDSGFTARLAQPGMKGLVVRYRLPVGQSSGSPESIQMVLQLATAGEEPRLIDLEPTETMKDRVVLLSKPTDEVFLVVPGPTGTFNPQSDPNCAVPSLLSAFIESIEVVPTL